MRAAFAHSDRPSVKGKRIAICRLNASGEGALLEILEILENVGALRDILCPKKDGRQIRFPPKRRQWRFTNREDIYERLTILHLVKDVSPFRIPAPLFLALRSWVFLPLFFAPHHWFPRSVSGRDYLFGYDT